MKIIVFGASRGTGSQVVKLALDAGHIVTAYVRSPGKTDCPYVVTKCPSGAYNPLIHELGRDPWINES